jgi:hypothetical protein
VAQKIIRLFLVFICSVAGSSGHNIVQTFVSPDGIFQVKYSKLLVACDPEKDQPGQWLPRPPCGECGRNNVVACLAHREDVFSEKPAFGAANFQVRELNEVSSEDACLNGLELPEDGETLARIVRINGVPFKAVDSGGLAGHSYVSGTTYRTYHANVCFELDTEIQIMDLQVMEVGPHKEFTNKDWAEVSARLAESLNTFKFLK